MNCQLTCELSCFFAGFFSALDTSKSSKKYIGTCKFGTTWTCTGLTTSHDKQGSFVGAVGGAIFNGDSYTGRPGGMFLFSFC